MFTHFCVGHIYAYNCRILSDASLFKFNPGDFRSIQSWAQIWVSPTPSRLMYIFDFGLLHSNSVRKVSKLISFIVTFPKSKCNGRSNSLRADAFPWGTIVFSFVHAHGKPFGPFGIDIYLLRSVLRPVKREGGTSLAFAQLFLVYLLPLPRPPQHHLRNHAAFWKAVKGSLFHRDIVVEFTSNLSFWIPVDWSMLCRSDL